VIRLDIKGFIPNTMLDWEGMLASTIFLPRCNYRCPFCQNTELVLHPERLQSVPLSAITSYIAERTGWVEGVCITGGEPCLSEDLPELCIALKAEGVLVKLDTNGSFPEMLERLITRGIIDYVALDVKAPLEPGPYQAATGVDDPDLLPRVMRSIEIVRTSELEHEFRTTVVPQMHGPEEVERIARYLEGEGRFVLQQFNPGDTLDPQFSSRRRISEEDMDSMTQRARAFIPDVVMRGAPVGIQH
jgi:pyruvate formate lyase activating enzyme